MTVLNLFLGLGEPLNAPINTPLPTHINRIRHNNYYDVFPKQGPTQVATITITITTLR